ncbi:hypothetical protein SAMN04515671_1553 [Nakamurella panacisegetis]|uniref:Uncharacterized protein n=1 Tax=Nakamurella panacisegetis TaxID=1090615 RepID=A0A1H0L6F7_9ACTN|nr:hypothetical protein SAMN04515671_1553 [Nakamurella panacisegetis]
MLKGVLSATRGCRSRVAPYPDHAGAMFHVKHGLRRGHRYPPLPPPSHLHRRSGWVGFRVVRPGPRFGPARAQWDQRSEMAQHRSMTDASSPPCSPLAPGRRRVYSRRTPDRKALGRATGNGASVVTTRPPRPSIDPRLLDVSRETSTGVEAPGSPSRRFTSAVRHRPGTGQAARGPVPATSSASRSRSRSRSRLAVRGMNIPLAAVHPPTRPGISYRPPGEAD